MGVNVIRLYNWEPGVDHSGFLDACHNDGEQSIKVLINRWINPATDWSDAASIRAISDQYLSMAEEIAAHPAGFGVLIGNEVNEHNANGSKLAFWQAMNTIASKIKEATPSLLVSMAITDRLDQVATYDSHLEALDAWSVQVYRGSTFGDLFDEYARSSEKPLLITEFGYDNYDNRAENAYPENGAYPAEVVIGLIEESWDVRGVCAGVFVFSYLDGLWKAEGSDTEYDPGGWVNPGFDDGFSNEEWWGIFRPAARSEAIDAVEPRALFGELQRIWGAPERLSLAFSEENGALNLELENLPLREDAVACLEEWDTLLEEWTALRTLNGSTLTANERRLFVSMQMRTGLFRVVSEP